MRDVFIRLVRLGVELSEEISIPIEMDWTELKALADQQGLSAVMLDGLNTVYGEGLTVNDSMPQVLRLEWIGEVLQGEQTYKQHQKVAMDMASLFHRNGIRTYVLKGRIVAECYPKPEHRVSSDMDCYLLPIQGEFDA